MTGQGLQLLYGCHRLGCQLRIPLKMTDDSGRT